MHSTDTAPKTPTLGRFPQSPPQPALRPISPLGVLWLFCSAKVAGGMHLLGTAIECSVVMLKACAKANHAFGRRDLPNTGTVSGRSRGIQTAKRCRFGMCARGSRCGSARALCATRQTDHMAAAAQSQSCQNTQA